jgi:hypothetical protein
MDEPELGDLDFEIGTAILALEEERGRKELQGLLVLA